MSAKPHQCQICEKAFKKVAHLRNHWAHSKCGSVLKERNAQKSKRIHKPHNIQRSPSPSLSIHSNTYADYFPEPPDSPADSPPPAKKFPPIIEDAEDDETAPQLSRDTFVSVDFVGTGAILEGKEEKNRFERFRDMKQKKGEEMWAPFKSREEWQLARWLMLSGISHGDIDAFAKLPIVRSSYDSWRRNLTNSIQIQNDLHPSFKDKRTFLRNIDALPTVRGGWTCKEMEIVRDILQVKDGKMIPKTESIELWMRNLVECVKELMEDPRFEDNIRYAPEKMFTDETIRIRAIDEMWTGDWWWATQVCKLSSVRFLF